MSTLLWGALATDFPRDIEDATRNSPPIQPDAAPAEMDHAPEFNELQTHNDPNLGFTNHQLASEWHQPEKYAPEHPELATQEHNALVDRRIATAGTAAERELSGQYGHGTLPYAVGIEPYIRESAMFGTDYFKSHEPGANPTTTYETGLQPGWVESQGSVSAAGKTDARDAAQASVTEDPYRAFLRG